MINSLAHRGRSAFLLKGSAKSKRKRNEIEEVKGEEEKLKANKFEYLREVKRLKKEKEDLDNRLVDLAGNEIILQNLLVEGVIDEAGNPIL